MQSLVGTTAPDFSALTSEGDEFNLSDLDGSWKVLFFYAEDGSPTRKRGCLSFKEQYNSFKSHEPPAEIIGISQNTVEEHKEFKEDLGLPFILISDPERKIAESYGVPVHLGKFPSKSSFVIGPDNKIHFVYDWLFRPRQHVAKILRSLSSVTS